MPPSHSKKGGVPPPRGNGAAQVHSEKGSGFAAAASLALRRGSALQRREPARSKPAQKPTHANGRGAGPVTKPTALNGDDGGSASAGDADYVKGGALPGDAASAREGSTSDSDDDDDEEEDGGEDSSSGGDSGDYDEEGGEGEGDRSGDDDDNDSSDGFEDQGSSSGEDDLLERQAESSEDDGDDEGDNRVDGGCGGGTGGASSSGGAAIKLDESTRRTWSLAKREREIKAAKSDGTLAAAQMLHVDDLSSDDNADCEDGAAPRNTIGRVPLHWYDEYDHIGYDVAGRKLAKSAGAAARRGDAVDAAIAAADDPRRHARIVYDAYNDREIELTRRDLELVRRIQSGAFPHPEFEAYPDYVDYATHEKEVMPLGAADEPKRRFVPSKWEMMKVHKIVQGIKEGRIVLDRKPPAKPDVYELWADGEEEDIASRKGPMHIPAPRMPLPGHAESYRPPEEYLLNEEELAQWEAADPSERTHDFIPKRFDSLRQVGAYAGLVKERFERCLDLYLCPRAFKRRLNIDPESLVPRLPRPRDLRPFPNSLAQLYVGHAAPVRCLACLEDGQHVASGDDAGVVILWEVATGRVARRFDLSRFGAVARLEANPAHDLLAAAAGSCVVLLDPGTASGDAAELVDALLAAAVDAAKAGGTASGGGFGGGSKAGAATVKWEAPAAGERTAAPGEAGVRAVLRRSGEVGWIAWHRKGDYIASVATTAGAGAVAVTQLSKASTQCPFKRSRGEVQAVRFHPSKPFLFVATKQHVRVYHLAQQALVKKLLTGCKWVSCLDVHPSGDHVLLGSYDRRVAWFDLDLASTPYRTLRYHAKAVRAATFHRGFPLMATASDDGAVHVFHAAVYSDLLRNPLIVPLKILRGHAVAAGGLGVLALAWHPRQPWLFSAGADGSVRLFQDI